MDKEDINLNELIDDIRRIKNSIKQNTCILKQMIYLPVLKLLFLIGGIITTFIPLCYYFLIKNYNRYETIPFEIRLLLVALIIIGVLLIGSGKFFVYYQARHLIPTSSWLKVFIKLFSRQVLLLYPGIVITMFFLTILFISQHSYCLIVPTWAIGMGICFSIIGSFTSFLELFIYGYYNWILGVISIPYIMNSPLTSLTWASGIFGMGMLGFYFYLQFFYRSDKEQ